MVGGLLGKKGSLPAKTLVRAGKRELWAQAARSEQVAVHLERPHKGWDKTAREARFRKVSAPFMRVRVPLPPPQKKPQRSPLGLISLAVPLENH